MSSEFDHEEAKIRQRSVAETLNTRRQSLGLSLRDLETRSGIRHSTINDVFRRNDMRLWQFFALAKALDMSIPQVVLLADIRYREIIAQETDCDEFE